MYNNIVNSVKSRCRRGEAVDLEFLFFICDKNVSGCE